MIQENSCLVMQITLKSNTYYVTDRPDISLDGNVYRNVVLSWGNIEFFGNIGDGEFQTGSTEVVLMNGEEYIDAGYNFDPTDIWNNYTAEIRRYSSGMYNFVDYGDGLGCLPVKKGKIKNYQISNNQISFSIEDVDSRDSILIPGVICVDNSSLDESDARTTITGVIGGSGDTISVTDSSIFYTGELVFLTENTGDTEYARILSIDSDNNRLTFYEDVQNSFSSGTNYIEKAFRVIPKKFIDQTIPVLFGDLGETGNIFAKLITTNGGAGTQKIICDYIKTTSISQVGIFFEDMREYLKAEEDEDYTINNNIIDFEIDTEATLSEDIVTISGGIQVIKVSSIDNIIWYDEDTVENANPEMLTVSVIKIDQELMQVVDKPSNIYIQVERGYNGTNITTHNAGAKIYQSSKYSSKNLISFFHLFPAVASSNYYYKTNPGAPTLVISDIMTGWNNIIDGDLNTYYEIYYDISEQSMRIINFDIKFANIEKSYKVIYSCLALKSYLYLYLDADSSLLITKTRYNHFKFALYDPNQKTERDEDLLTQSAGTGNQDFNYHIQGSIEYSGLTAQTASIDMLIDNYSTFSGDNQTTVYHDSEFTNIIKYKPNYNLEYLEYDYTGSENYLYSNNYKDTGRPFVEAAEEGPYIIDKLTDLNKKWKFSMLFWYYTAGIKFRLNTIGIWCRFLVDFTENELISKATGRQITETVSDITKSTEGNLCEHPKDVCCQLLTQEMQYEEDDFGYTWRESSYKYCYVMNYNTTLEIIDVTIPERPVQVSTTDLSSSFGGYSYDFKLYEDKIYLTNGTDRLMIIDVSDKMNPTVDKLILDGELGGVDLTGAKGLDIEGNYLYVGTTTKMEVIDISDTENPVHVGTAENGVGGVTINESQELQYVAEFGYVFVSIKSGVEIIDVSTPSSPTHVNLISITNYVALYRRLRMKIVGDYLYYCQIAALDTFNLLIYDISDPGSPNLESTTSIDDIWGLWVYNDKAYLTNTVLDQWDVTNKAAPSKTKSTYNTGRYGEITFDTENDLVYFFTDPASGDDSINVYNDDDLSKVNIINPFGNMEFSEIKQIVLASEYDHVRDVAFSYGGKDDQIEGWKFTSTIASHYLYQIMKNYSGKIDIIDIYQIYNKPVMGSEIKIEDILFVADSGVRKLSVFHTGSDLICNDFIVKYKRNNATDEFEGVYVLPDTYTMVKSGITLQQARIDYYDGRKKTLEIESRFIYSENIAKKLAEWHADDKAEVHFYCEIYLDYKHYSDKNSLNTQYQIGDIIYLNGTDSGITFDSSKPLYIKDISILDSGREILIKAKSLHPISSF